MTFMKMIMMIMKPESYHTGEYPGGEPCSTSLSDCSPSCISSGCDCHGDCDFHDDQDQDYHDDVDVDDDKDDQDDHEDDDKHFLIPWGLT